MAIVIAKATLKASWINVCFRILADGKLHVRCRPNARQRFTMRAHDVEEFVGVVRRYGAEATPAALALVQAAQNRPEIAAASIAAACGTCLLRRVA